MDKIQNFFNKRQISIKNFKKLQVSFDFSTKIFYEFFNFGGLRPPNPLQMHISNFLEIFAQNSAKNLIKIWKVLENIANFLSKFCKFFNAF